MEILNLLIKEEFILIELGPVTFDQLHSLLGLGVFNSDGNDLLSIPDATTTDKSNRRKMEVSVTHSVLVVR